MQYKITAYSTITTLNILKRLAHLSTKPFIILFGFTPHQRNVGHMSPKEER
jgi:hypothetical protein